MFKVKLMAFVCTEFLCYWTCIWTGDNLNQLSKSDFRYFLSFYGADSLHLTSSYDYDDDDVHIYDYDDDEEIW